MSNTLQFLETDSTQPWMYTHDLQNLSEEHATRCALCDAIEQANKTKKEAQD